jgi:hypothetical protein
MSPDIYVVMPGGTQTDGETIHPAEMVEQFGNQIRVRLGVAPLSWLQWVHIDTTLFPEEVEEV